MHMHKRYAYETFFRVRTANNTITYPGSIPSVVADGYDQLKIQLEYRAIYTHNTG